VRTALQPPSPSSTLSQASKWREPWSGFSPHPRARILFFTSSHFYYARNGGTLQLIAGTISSERAQHTTPPTAGDGEPEAVSETEKHLGLFWLPLSKREHIVAMIFGLLFGENQLDNADPSLLSYESYAREVAAYTKLGNRH
jgi:hypothetical protein